MMIIAVAYGGFLVVYWRLMNVTLDDAYISLRYAQHLARGEGLVYNIGERVEGYTNLAWTALLAVPFLVHADPIAFIKATNACLVLACALTLYLIGLRSAFADRPLGATVAPLLYLCAPAIAISAAEGLETTLFSFLVLWSFLLLIATSRVPPVISAIGFTLVAMTRPDGIVFVAAALVYDVLARRVRVHGLRFVTWVVILYGSYFLLRYHYYGDLFPNTLYAKGGGDPALLRRGLAEIGTFAWQYGLVVWPIGLVGLRHKQVRPLVAALWVAILLRAAFSAWSGGAWAGYFRFLVPTLPLIFLALSIGLGAVFRDSARYGLGAVVLGLVCVGPAWRAYPAWHLIATSYAVGLQRAHVAFGKEVARESSSEAVLAMDDAGAGPFFAERTSIDMLGLNDRHIAHLRGGFYEKVDTAYILARRPDLVVLLSYVTHPTRPADFRVRIDGALFASQAFQDAYAPWKSYEFGPNYYLLVYRRDDSANVPAAAKQDGPPTVSLRPLPHPERG